MQADYQGPGQPNACFEYGTIYINQYLNKQTNKQTNKNPHKDSLICKYENKCNKRINKNYRKKAASPLLKCSQCKRLAGELFIIYTQEVQ